jgi:integrase
MPKHRNVENNRKHLNPEELKRIMKVAKTHGRYALRNQVIIHLMARHGFRVSELINLTLEQIDLKNDRLHVKRLKNGMDATHPIQGDTKRLLKRYFRWREEQGIHSHYLLINMRGVPFHRTSIFKICQELANKAGIKIKVGAHTFRHACGYDLGEQTDNVFLIQQYLGHRNVANTKIYVQLNPNKFNNLFKNK